MAKKPPPGKSKGPKQPEPPPRGSLISGRTAWGAAGLVVAVLAVLVVIALLAREDSSSDSDATTTASVPTTTAPTDTTTGTTTDETETTTTGEDSAQADEVVRLATNVPAATIAAVGDGGSAELNTIDNPEQVTANGLPLVLYVGGEFCPYCAAERWAILNALGRFGTFSGVGLTTSATDDVFPDTPSVTFSGSTFASDVVALQTVEVVDREHNDLDTLTPEQEQLLQKYDQPPYVEQTGAIPFLLVGGTHVLSGSQYQPSVLEGKTHLEVATAMSDPNSDISKGAVGSANRITAAICGLTANKPAKVCDADGVRQLRAGA